MARYLMLWELERARIPVDPKERAAVWTTLVDMVKEGRSESWGQFVGEMKGYCLVSGSEMDIAMMVQRYTPYVYFKTSQVVTIDDIEATLKQMAG
jgi:hypothetical protein